MSRRNTRRDFIKTTTLASVGYWAAGGVSLAQSNSANEQINFACIGVGGKGRSDSSDANANGNIVAICDIDDRTLEKAAKTEGFEKAKQYNDYRKMFDEFAKSIDAVTVSTPDHSHAPAAAMAMRLGKHCFCQKPLTHSIYEARKLGELAKENKLATQMGNQGTAGDGLRQAAAIVQTGALGDVKEVHVWTNRPIWAQGGPRPKPAEAPSHVHWDLFIGPAPYREYAGGYHPFAWRGWWDFGTGALGDMACHTMNMPFMALDLRDPVAVTAETSGHNKDSYPKSSKIKYEFAATDKRPALVMYWYDGGNKPDADMLEGEKMNNSGSIIIGTKGKLYAPDDYGRNFKVMGVEAPEVEFTRSPGHFVEFAQAIKGGPAAVSNFPGYASPLSETVLLGNLAVWCGERVEWDGPNMKCTNRSDLDNIVKPEYREGYTL